MPGRPARRLPALFWWGVLVELADGRVLVHKEPINRGAAGRPISNEDIVAKYRDNAARAVDRAQADHILNAVLGLEQGEAADLARLLGRAAKGPVAA
jgi:hypothetical protein